MSQLFISGSIGPTTEVNQMGDGGADGVVFPNTKLGFFGITTSVAQQTNPGNVSTGATGGTSTVFLNTTFTGGVTGKGYTVGDIVAALKNYGLIAS